MGTRASSVRLLLACLIAWPSIGAADRLRIEGITGGDNVAVMVNARTKPGAGGCELLEVSRSTGEASLGNLLAGCSPWVAVLSANNAMAFDVPAWTDGGDDEHLVKLLRLIDVPVRVWIANPAAADDAVDDMAYANLVYERNKVGIQFVPVFKDVPPESAAMIDDGIEFTPDGSEFRCRNLRAIQESRFYVGHTLNVYYVKKRAITGRNCAITRPEGDGNITFIASAANRATLAHELGHAFGLRPADAGGHTSPAEGFSARNVMTGNGTQTRDHFTAGQVFRMNTHVDRFGGSMLIENGLRTSPKLECAPLAVSQRCPALGADWPRP